MIGVLRMSSLMFGDRSTLDAIVMQAGLPTIMWRAKEKWTTPEEMIKKLSKRYEKAVKYEDKLLEWYQMIEPRGEFKRVADYMLLVINDEKSWLLEQIEDLHAVISARIQF